MGRKPRWTARDLEYLSDNYGILPDGVIGRRLGRSLRSLRDTARRRLHHLRHTDNFYSARELARLLGVCDKTVVAWRSLGLKGRRSPFGKRRRRWTFSEEQITGFLAAHSDLVNPAAMEPHYFRTIVENARNASKSGVVIATPPPLADGIRPAVIHHVDDYRMILEDNDEC